MLRNLLNKKSNWNKTAIIQNDSEISFGKLFEKAAAITAHFGDFSGNIAIMLPNGADFISALFGVVMLGGVAFPLNIFMKNSEIIPLLKKANIKKLITTNEYFHRINEIKKSLSTLKILCIEQLKVKPIENELKLYNLDENKPMLLLNTSGTTDNCKIVMLSEKNIRTSVLGYIDKMSFDPKDSSKTRFLLSAPFFSAYGIMILCACLMLAFPLVVLGNVFTLDSFYKAVEMHQVTNYEGSASVVFMMDKMAFRPACHNISTLKNLGFGGSKVSGAVIERVSKAYKNMRFYQGYGMTEASPLIAKHPATAKIKFDSVGAIINGVKVAIKKDNKITTAPFQRGEILVRGANVMLGYYKNKKATNKIIKNGYLHSGDIGYLDEDGYLYICGRKKSMIIVRGFNVFPEEIEDCLQNSGLVKDCFVYACADTLGNEIICASIVPASKNVKKAQLRSHLSKHLALYKLPQKITLCGSIKKNAAGKTLLYRKPKS